MKSVQQQLGLPKPIASIGHEFVMAIMLCSRLLSAKGRTLLAKSGLREAQFNILMLLKYQFPNGTSQIELSRMILVNRANITGLVSRMLRQNLIERARPAGDMRSYIVRLTNSGAKRLAVAEKQYFAGIRELSDRITEVRMRETLEVILSVCEVANDSER